MGHSVGLHTVILTVVAVAKWATDFVLKAQAARRNRLEIKKLEHDAQEGRILPAKFDEIVHYDAKTKAVVDAVKKRQPP